MSDVGAPQMFKKRKLLNSQQDCFLQFLNVSQCRIYSNGGRTLNIQIGKVKQKNRNAINEFNKGGREMKVW